MAKLKIVEEKLDKIIEKQESKLELVDAPLPECYRCGHSVTEHNRSPGAFCCAVMGCYCTGYTTAAEL